MWRTADSRGRSIFAEKWKWKACHPVGSDRGEKRRKAGQSGFTDSEQVRGRMAANRQSVQRNPVYPSGDNLWRFKIRSLCRGGWEKSFYRSERGDTGRRRSLSVPGCTEWESRQAYRRTDQSKKRRLWGNPLFRDPDEGSALFYSKSKDTAGVCRGIEKGKGGRCEDLGVRLWSQ